MSNFTQATYDEAPYPFLSHSNTHPDKLAVIATLLDLSIAPAQNCRVLELGCAIGGNLIPLAEALPESEFVGIDNSAKQIQQASAMASSLALENIRFHTMDILDIEPDFGTFDYIIAHGIYSWIPAQVRDKLLQICQQNLASNGIAYVSYNVLPGYHMMLMMREMMLWHTRNTDGSSQRIHDAFDLVNFLKNATHDIDPRTAYHAFLNQYVGQRFMYGENNEGPALDTTLLHGEMESTNQPVYFHEFAAHAAQYGLQYVAEVPFSEVMMPDISAAVQQKLGKYATDIIELEQYLDFIRNRMFRRTLLCHDDQVVQRKLSPNRATSFYVASYAQPAGDADAASGIERFQIQSGATLSTDHPISKAALHYLAEISPVPIAFDDLLEAACERLQVETATETDRIGLASTLLKGFMSGRSLIELFTYQPGFVTTVSEYPKARPLARLDAQRSDQPHTTNLRHERVTLDQWTHLLLPHLDGTQSHDMLLETLSEYVSANRIEIRDEDNNVLDREASHPYLAQQLAANLQWLAHTALLVG